MKFPTHYPSLNALWSNLILEELWRLGVRDCCIAPGSRSAPLTLAAANHAGLKKHIHFDERGLSFFALGLAKASCRPVVVITTSGTAVANLYPGVIEARQSGIPLILLTADRPPELINCGANQAIEQQAIFGGYPEETLTLPTPSEDLPVNWLLTSIDQAFARSAQKGLPLHINCMFREPLYPGTRQHNFHTILHSAQRWLESGSPYTTYPDYNYDAVRSNPDFWRATLTLDGIIVVGRLGREVDLVPMVQLAEQLQWPVLADVQSGIHGHPYVIQHSDLLLSCEKGQALLASSHCLLQFGGYLVSKRLTEFVGQSRWQQHIMISNEQRRIDPGHCQSHHFFGSINDICRSLIELTSPPASVAAQSSQRLQKIRLLNGQISSIISQQLADDENLSEAWIGSRLADLLPEDCSLFVGNSLSIRLVDMLSTRITQYVYTNRGVSGIDGLLATAVGCAVASGKPLVCLVGDLSFLHDLNSLALARTVKTPLVFIVLNNDGGGIFNMLPLGLKEEQAATYFQTPHHLNGAGAATMFGLDYHAPEIRESFKNVLTAGLNTPRCTLIEVKTNPGEAVQFMRKLIVKTEGL